MSFARSVLRFMPSMSAACVWLPLARVHDRREQRALDVTDHHVVDAVRRLAVELAEILVERLLDAAADLVAAVQAHVSFHAARASPAHVRCCPLSATRACGATSPRRLHA